MTIYYRNDQWNESAIAYFQRNNIELPIWWTPYTIREIVKGQDGIYRLLLNEIKNPLDPTGKEFSFQYHRFSTHPDCPLNNVLSWEDVEFLYIEQVVNNG